MPRIVSVNHRHKIWFTSDTHYSHSNIIKYSKRPFENTHEMNVTLLNNYNSLVKPDDHVFILGDFAFMNLEKTVNLLKQMIGIKYFVFGNHDKVIAKNYTIFKELFEGGVYDYLELNVNDKTIQQHLVLSHYSFRVWNRSHHGSFNCYGHSHGALPEPETMKSMDIGVDAVAKRFGVCKENYRPISFNEVNAVLSKRQFVAVDDHGDDDA